MIKVVILTSSSSGTAAHHLPYLLKCADCQIAMVILSKKSSNPKKSLFRMLKKIARIGVAGALNGIRMRKWYTEDVKKYASIPDLEETCKGNKIPFYKTPAINSEETEALFRKAGADVGISLGNGYIKSRIFSVPAYGMINIHHEMLPAFQNAQSIIWQLYNGSAQTGFTIHKINQHIDKGEILFQSPIPIKFKDTLADTVANTSALLLEGSAKGLVFVLENFEHLFKSATKQGKGKTYTTPSFWQFRIMQRNFKKLKKMAQRMASEV